MLDTLAAERNELRKQEVELESKIAFRRRYKGTRRHPELLQTKTIAELQKDRESVRRKLAANEDAIAQAEAERLGHSSGSQAEPSPRKRGRDDEDVSTWTGASGTSSHKKERLGPTVLEGDDARLVKREFGFISGALRLPAGLTDDELRSIDHGVVQCYLHMPIAQHDIKTILDVRDKWPKGVEKPDQLKQLIFSAEEQNFAKRS